MTESILQEAARLTNGARQATYGHPLDDLGRTATMWGAILGVPVSAEQVALCMVAVKISREVHAHRRDNVVDGAGYWNLVDMIHEERERRAATGYSGMRTRMAPAASAKSAGPR